VILDKFTEFVNGVGTFPSTIDPAFILDHNGARSSRRI